MPYTITCHHHRSGHRDRHPSEWDGWEEAAQELGAWIHQTILDLSPALNDAELASVRTFADQAAHTGVVVLPGLASFRVVDVSDAPSDRPAPRPPGEQIDWPQIGRLARRAQTQTITLNHLAAVAPGTTQDASVQAHAALTELAELCTAIFRTLAP